MRTITIYLEVEEDQAFEMFNELVQNWDDMGLVSADRATLTVRGLAKNPER